MEVCNDAVSAERNSTKKKPVEKVATPTISYPNMLMTTQKIEIHAS